jgi:very-short-patch-repair endonuclease
MMESLSIPMDALFECHPKSKLWCQAKNGTVTPSDIRCNNQAKPFWFHCDVCGHDFDSIVRSIVLSKHSGCGYCSNKRRCPSDVECEFCYKNSFASHDRATYWSTKNTTTPRDWALSCNKKFWFTCDNNHTFEMVLNNISSANKWCKQCGYVAATQKQRFPLEKFLKEAEEKHGKKYLYKIEEYVNTETKLTIICPEHGAYKQTPYNHLRSEGCSECGRIKAVSTRTTSKEELLIKFREIHGDKYSYDLEIYENLKSNITIICPDHGAFEQQVIVHLMGCGCTPCGRLSQIENWKGSYKGESIKRLTPEEYITRAKVVHEDKYSYEKTVYLRAHEKVIITCRTHGDFLQDPWNHLSGTGCKRCTAIYNTEDFIKKASVLHSELYDYSKVDYKTSHTNVIIGCSTCGFFEQRPNVHLRGAGCPTCVNKTQQKLLLWLKKYYDVIPEFKSDWCIRKETGRQLRFDFLIKELNIIIELDGGQHFKQVSNWRSPEEQINLDVYKMQKAHNNGYTVIRLLQDDVYRNTNTWLDEQLKPELHMYEEPTYMFIYDEEKHGEIYKRHIELIEGPDIDLECIEGDSNSDESSIISDSSDDKITHV